MFYMYKRVDMLFTTIFGFQKVQVLDTFWEILGIGNQGLDYRD